MEKANRTLLTREVLTGTPSFDVLCAKARQLYESGVHFLNDLTVTLRDNAALKREWDAVRKTLQESGHWLQLRQNWRSDAVSAMLPEAVFTHGGDHTSATYRNARQQAVIACASATARAVDPAVDDEAVVAQCIDAVGQRWRPDRAAAVAVVHRVVRRVALAVRRNPSTSAADAVVDPEFDALVLTEVTVATTAAPEDANNAWFERVDPQAMPEVAVELLRFLAERQRTRQKEMECGVERERIAANRDVALRGLELRGAAAADRKRKRDEPADDAALEAQAARPCRGLLSLDV